MPFAQSTSALARRGRIAWWLLAVVAVATWASVARQPPDLYTDAATCVWSAAQREAGQTDTWHTIVEPTPDDLSTDRATRLVWWPSTYEAIPAVWRRCGLNWGAALRATFLSGWLVGIVGWAVYFRAVVPSTSLPWLLVAFVSFRYSHSNANIYDGGEFLFWAVFPWVWLLNLAAAHPTRRQTSLWALLAGAATPALVLVKYSAGLSAIGVGAAWLALLARRRINVARTALWLVGAAASAGMILAAGSVAQTNPATVRDQWQWVPIWWGAGAWLFAMSDLEILVMKVGVHLWEQPWLPAVGLHGDGQISWLIPLPLALVAALLVTGSRMPRASDESQGRQWIAEMAIAHLAGFTLVLVAILCTGARVHMDARFLRPAAIAVLPFLFNELVSALRDDRRWRRILSQTLLALLIILPAAYGLATLAQKSIVRGAQAGNRVGPAGIRHDVLDGDGDALAFYREIDRLLPDSEGVIYVIDPSLAIPLGHRRVIVEHAQFRTLAHLGRKSYRGHPPGGILVALPASFTDNGRAERILTSFRDVTDWVEIRTPHQSNWVLWRSSEATR